MPKPSNAEDFFKLIMSQENKCAYLESLVNADPPILETEWREFKGCVNPTDGTSISDSDVAKYWSKALSGFANTAGGVLIWGLDARKDKESGLDCVGKLALHPDADRLRQKLADLLMNAVVPPLRGIEMHAIKHEGSKAGFVVCFIPEGDVKAYRAENAKQFYMRMSDNFDVPPVAVIRSLFFPTSSPFLVPSVAVEPDHKNSSAKLWFYVQNMGTRSAHDIHLIVGHEFWQTIEVLRSGHAFEPAQSPKKVAFHLRESLNPEIEDRIVGGINDVKIQDWPHGVTLVMKTSCEDTVMAHWTCTLERMQLMTAGKFTFTQDS